MFYTRVEDQPSSSFTTTRACTGLDLVGQERNFQAAEGFVVQTIPAMRPQCYLYRAVGEQRGCRATHIHHVSDWISKNSFHFRPVESLTGQT